ncbi:MAG: 2Fe-2S iron-sulfur cluster-binding protein [Neisseria sp.]|nr:2Fe-2S iron-sulfur cluster-binding protein [Neisseria sp.]
MSHTITLTPDDSTFEVQAGETILQAATRNGLNLPHSCQSGICGQCKAKVLSGSVTQSEYSKQALSDEEAADGNVLLCCSHSESDVTLSIPNYSGANMPQVRTLPARVSSVEYIANTAIVNLALPKAPPFDFLAGQYIDILLKNGTRSYSLASQPSERGEIQLHIRKRDNGLFSNMLFAEEPIIKEKTIMRIRGPLGTFTLKENDDAPMILLATGTGFAPIYSILQQLKESGSTRAVHLYWGARYDEDLYYKKEAAALCAELPNAKFTPVLSCPHDYWQGKSGYVQDLALQDYPDLSQHQVYACGSAGMIFAARDLFCQKAGLRSEQFFSDTFTAAH